MSDSSPAVAAPLPLLPCPHCGSADIDPTFWASKRASGPGCNECSATAETIESWNRRTDLVRGALLANLKNLVGLAGMRGGNLHEYGAAIADARTIIAKAETRK